MSFAGRLQLVISVLSSMHVYWSSVFILSATITLEIEKILRGFLWCQGDMKRGKSKVSWKIVCMQKNEGGLGVKSLSCWNNALMSYHIWSDISNKESLWVKWANEYRLKGRSFWEENLTADASWGGGSYYGYGMRYVRS